MSKINVALDATMLDMLQLCEQRFDYRFNQNKVSPEKPKALDRGSLVHLGTETYYKALKDKKPFDDSVMLMTAAVRLAGTESDLEPDICKRVLEVLHEYVEFWRTEDQRYEILEVEQPFSYVLFEDDEIRIIMIGKIDLLINDNQYLNMPIDHKSYDRDYPVKRFTNQFCNYSYATKSNYILVNKIGFQTSLKPEQKYKRVPLSYDPLILEDWKQNTIRWARRYVEAVVTNSWPMNLTSCDKFNRTCEYFEVCDSSGVEAKTYKLVANFKTAPKWDVSQSLGRRE